MWFIFNLLSVRTQFMHTHLLSAMLYKLHANRVLILLFTLSQMLISLQCSDTVGWATGRATSLYKAGRWFVDGDNLT